MRGDLNRRRADIVGFVNGLSFLFMELKNVSRDIRTGYEQNFLTDLFGWLAATETATAAWGASGRA